MMTRNAAIPRLCGLLLVGVIYTVFIGISNASVRFEHLAINVENPKKVADWYVKYVGLKIVSASKKMIFVSDPGKHFMFELYKKDAAKGKFSDLNHAAGHVAFATDDAEALAGKMVQGGAKKLKQFNNPVGDTVINMQDPWGNNLQVIHRVKPKL
jgi:catechol-2,3-dioxygenase